MTTTLSLGSHGPDVGRIEGRLAQLGLYTGSLDNIFGGGVESAVKAFQKSQGISPDGALGDQTWSLLFPGTQAAVLPAPNPLLNAPLAQRCLALTGTFETSTGFPDCYAGLSGDFDGQGMSLGVAQWNIGQGTLQPLLAEMFSQHEDLARSLFHDHADEIQTLLSLPLAGQLAWARGIQDPARHEIFEPWRALFKTLCRTPEFQSIQTEHAAVIHAAALTLCEEFGVISERAIALMFDIRVQNHSISPATEAIIRADFSAIPSGTAPMDIELSKLRSIANRRAEAANPKYVEDVRVRKLTIANGTGTVHGIVYDLEAQYGIRLQKAE